MLFNIKNGDILEVTTKMSEKKKIIGIFDGFERENRRVYMVLKNATEYRKMGKKLVVTDYNTYKILKKIVKKVIKVNNNKFKHCPKCKYGRLIYNKRIKKYICVLCGHEVER